jgi:WXXGXW repeat (2 copies)
MKHGFVIAGMAALAMSAPALAQTQAPTPLHSGVSPYTRVPPATQPAAEVAQAQNPAYPPIPPYAVAPTQPPPLQSEVPPPAPTPSYVWEPGHWSWNGVQYIWQPGKYVERPTVSASYVPGHWEQQAAGWVWIPGRWDYSGIGSSTPPAAYPPVR